MSTPRQATLVSHQMRVQFAWQGDRYAHAIEVSHGGSWREVLRSVEGVADEAWPASPPLQSLTLEDRAGGGRVGLLVGMAGKCHWSASIALESSTAGVHFEIACRVGAGQSGPLGSRYQLGDSCTAERTPEGVVVHLPHDLVLQINPIADCGHARIALDNVRLSIDPGDVSVVARAQTIRWGYAVRVARD
jgi:hypothetical protein